MIQLATIRDVEAVEATLLEEQAIPENTYAVFRDAALKHGDAPAITLMISADEGAPVQTLSYSELLGRITQTANLFHACGVACGDAVSFLLPNLLETHLSLWGAETAGIVNPVNPFLEPEAIIDILNEASAKVLVTTGPALGAELWRKAMMVVPHVPTLAAVIVVGDGADASALPAGVSLLDFHEAIAGQPADDLVFEFAPKADDIVAYFHTGGTTGTPKLAQHTQHNECFEAWYLANSQGIEPGNVCLCGLPLFHVNAVIVSGLGPFLAGAHVVLLTPAGFRDPGVIQNFWRIVEQYQANFFSAVPTVYGGLLSVPVAGRDISSLRFGICGAAPMPKELIHKVETTMGLKLLEGYGLTEGTCVSSCNPVYGECKAGSIGIRMPYQEMKAARMSADGQIAEFCGPDEAGVLVIRGPNVFAGYKQADKNEGVLLEGGWLNTGDLGRVDEEGYVWLTGRAKDLIIRGGHNIDPGMIEGALAKHPAVQMVAAVGQPDSYAGELPIAYVQLVPGQNANVEELMAFARSHIPERAAVPVRIEILEVLPLTAVGKTFKPALRCEAAAFALDHAVREAGASADVTVRNEENRGMVVYVQAANPQAKVQEVMGQFPFDVEYGAPEAF